MKHVTLITTCTGRKRVLPKEEAHFRNVPKWDPDAAARHWLSQLAGLGRTRADKMYSGRGFAEARRAAELLGAPLKIISAGLGLVDAEAEVPSYEATISPGLPNAIPTHLGIAPDHWWAVLKQYQRFEWPSGCRLLLIAASGSYLQMVERDLLTLPVERLRLFTRTEVGALPADLRSAVMPYDDRLEAEGGRPGTVADFAQRAMADFTQFILPNSFTGGVEDHAALVRSRLEPLAAPMKRVGRRATDDEIRAAIGVHYHAVGGQSSRMLQKLRRELGIACEQSRFRDLFNNFEELQGEGMECLPL
ncbi:hypothetical protein [Microvirga aerophila]|uniref:Uncharacterized protein n=1 Tax=Microvirga aerophila TaxID=670291 RepID=A0A512BKV9_9HYPH|nr:hypothetical protein [Microvirga aerophila]GEO12606.1 hypothetical protein MAE02_03020 [Microvirga aerophila]